MSFIRDALNGKDAIFIHLCWWIVVDVLLYVGIHMLICSRLWNNCTDSEWAVLQMSYALWKLAYVYMVLTVQRARTVLFSIMCPFSAYFREAEEMTFIWHMSVLWREFVSLRLGLCVCQWYYCKSVIHTPQGRSNHWGLCCRPKCEEILSCHQERAKLRNDNVRAATKRIKKNLQKKI